MKLHKILLTCIATSCIMLSIGSLPVDASSWHKGTPKSLRGTYVSKKTIKGMPHTVFVNKIFLQPKAECIYSQTYKHGKEIVTSPMMGLAKVYKYKKISKNTYKLAGELKFNGGKSSMYIRSYKKNHIKSSPTTSFAKQDLMHRISTKSNIVF